MLQSLRDHAQGVEQRGRHRIIYAQRIARFIRGPLVLCNRRLPAGHRIQRELELRA